MDQTYLDKGKMIYSDTPQIRSRLDLLYLVTREFNVGLDINQVLNRVLSATVAAVGAFDASIFLIDDKGSLDNFFLISNFTLQRRSRATMEQIYERGLVGWIKQHRTGVLIPDISNDDRWYIDKNNPEVSKAGCAIAVPIQLPDQLLGVLTITATEPGFFNESDLAVLTIIADQAAFAIANARLYEAEQRGRRLADTLTSVIRTINSTLDLNEVLYLILEQLSLVIDYDSSSILLYDGEALHVRAARGFDDLDDALKVSLYITEDTPNTEVILHKQPLLIPDVEAEPRWKKSTSSAKVRSWIGAPLVARDKVIGMITVDSNTPGKYNMENVRELGTFADHAATAVANAQVVTSLRNAEASYTALFDDSTDLILITSYNGLILDANRKACQMLRRHKDALIGSDITFIDTRLGEFLQEQTKRLKVWREVTLELDVLDAYRQIISLEFRCRQVHYNSRDCVQWVGRDISARKELERMRQDLINMLVHDLRGPLGNLINTIDLLPMLLGSAENKPNLDYLLGMARRSGQEVKDLVDSILDVGRLEEGDVLLQRNLVELEEIMQAVRDQVTPRALSKKMELVIDPLPEMPLLWVDASMIRRVLINLIDNGLKYTPSEGRVRVTTTCQDGTLHISVADSGPGISKEDQPHIFNKFSRVDYSSNAPSGVGLGLAFCKLAVEAHGGSIFIESEGVAGQGSTFHLSIPIKVEEE